MEEIRVFIKKNARIDYKLSISYNQNYNLFKYKFDDFILLFKEVDGEIESLTYNKKVYKDFIEIQLLLFNLFDYKNIEYIDVYLQSIKGIYIENIYDDYYDNNSNELICNRTIKKDEKIIKIKIIVTNMKDYTLYYNDEIIIGFSLILDKILQIFN